MLSLFSLVLALLPVVLSAPHERSNEPTIASFAGEYTCPNSLRPFHATTSILIPHASAERVWQELGDFCEVEWQGFEITATKGACNTHRSLRSYHAADLQLSERLDLIHLPSLSSSLFSRSRASSSQVYAHGYTMLNRPNLAGADVIRMKSLLKVVPFGSGSKVSWDAVGCSDYPEHLADKLEEVHEGALWAAEANIREAPELAAVAVDETNWEVLEQVMEAATLA